MQLPYYSEIHSLVTDKLISWGMGGIGRMTSEQFFFSGHVPCNFLFIVIFFGRGEVVEIGSICISP